MAESHEEIIFIGTKKEVDNSGPPQSSVPLSHH